jgi:hypothetical protein
MSSLLQRIIIEANLPATHTQRPFSVVYLLGARRSSAVTSSILALLCSCLLIHLFKTLHLECLEPYSGAYTISVLVRVSNMLTAGPVGAYAL